MWMQIETRDAYNASLRCIPKATSSQKVSKEAQVAGMQRASLPERRPKASTASTHGFRETHTASSPAQTSLHGQQESPLGPSLAATLTPTTVHVTRTATGGLASQGYNFARGSQSDSSRVLTTFTREAESHPGTPIHIPASTNGPVGQRDLQNNTLMRSSNPLPMFSLDYKNLNSAWTQICRYLLPPIKIMILND